MIVGYARVSTTDQRLDIQLTALNKAGCEKIYEEKLSGANAARPQLQACLDYVRDGDTLVITRLDRLARSLAHLMKIDETLKQRKVPLRVLDQNIDTSDATGRLMFGMLGAIAQFERELLKERQFEGIARAQLRGVHFGRAKRLTPDEIEKLCRLRNEGQSVKTLTEKFKMTRASIYRYLAEGKELLAEDQQAAD